MKSTELVNARPESRPIRNMLADVNTLSNRCLAIYRELARPWLEVDHARLRRELKVIDGKRAELWEHIRDQRARDRRYGLGIDNRKVVAGRAKHNASNKSYADRHRILSATP